MGGFFFERSWRTGFEYGHLRKKGGPEATSALLWADFEQIFGDPQKLGSG